MCTSQSFLVAVAGLAMVALVSAESLDDNTASGLYKLLNPSYDSHTTAKRSLDLYEGSPDLDWEAKQSKFSFGSPIRRPVLSLRRNLMQDKRFGYVGSRGKRMDHADAFMTLRDLLDLYQEKAKTFRSSSNYRKLTSEDAMLNNKRQPHFGFHGVRG